ncbi:MAG: methylated-DNA--[protein]-cysteine S-methyltransferase, partial [Verrucomicrobiales bacterium]
KLVLFASSRGLAAVFFHHRIPEEPQQADDPENPHLNAATHQLKEYFDRSRTRFELSLDRVGTPFQTAVWTQLEAIPFGETSSYGDIAKRLSKPGAMRAVGLANGCNPVSIIVPCHRVIGADGSLTGFGGGLEIKRQLLSHEGVLLGLT